MPPLTCIVSPVIYEASSDDKKATVLETSSPVPRRFMGILEINIITHLKIIKIYKNIFLLINYSEIKI